MYMGKKQETCSSASEAPNMGEESINDSVHHPTEMGHQEYHRHSSSVPKSNDESDNSGIDGAGGAGGGGGGGGPNEKDSGANEEGERSSSSNNRPADPMIICGRTNLQPFDISVTNPSAAFKSPGWGMSAAAANLGFPFTPVQWKELERQAMIYKYMIASVPVPPDLLFPVVPARNIPATDPSIPWNNGNGAYLRYGNNTNKDLEPGRCKRTDGKKWRCSREVAPHQKYCERHMHRGRPRSRKHVEIHQSSVDNNNNKPGGAATSAAANNNKKPRPQTNPAASKYSPSPQFIDPKPKEALFLDQQSILPQSNNFKQPSRVFGWQMGGENGGEQQWLHLMDTKRGMDDSVVFDSVLEQGYVCEEPLNLFSYGTPDFGHGNPTRGFIDAWSNHGEMKAMEEESSKQNLWPRGDDMLTLSMAAGMGMDSEHKAAAKCCPVSWQPFHSGGPLAEVLGRSSSIPASPYTGNGDSISPPATSVSSPTGILHRALFSPSDSSVGNSPTLGASNATPDLIAFQWLN